MEQKHPGGRPTKYDPKYNRQAYRHCLLGATDEELAIFFEVDLSTINLWKLTWPKFSESIKKGKSDADEKVAESLFKRANGYSHPDVDIKIYDGEIITTKLTKHYPPDTTAAIFWLKNRQKKNWRDKTEVDNNIKIGKDLEDETYED